MSIEVCKICGERMDTDTNDEIYEYGFPFCGGCKAEHESNGGSGGLLK